MSKSSNEKGEPSIVVNGSEAPSTVEKEDPEHVDADLSGKHIEDNIPNKCYTDLASVPKSADAEVTKNVYPKARADVTNLAGGATSLEPSDVSGAEHIPSNVEFIGDPVYNLELPEKNSGGTTDEPKKGGHDTGTAADLDADCSVPTREDGKTPGEEHISASAVDHAPSKILGNIASNSLLICVSCDAIEKYGGLHRVLVAGEANAIIKTKDAYVATGGEGNGGATHFESYHGCDVSAGTVSPSSSSVYKGRKASESCVSPFNHPTVKNCTDSIVLIDADVTSAKAKETHGKEKDAIAIDTDGAKSDPFDKRAYSCKSNIELTTCAHSEVLITE